MLLLPSLLALLGGTSLARGLGFGFDFPGGISSSNPFSPPSSSASSSAGKTACKAIADKLGDDKVLTQSYNITYITSTKDYWSTRCGKNEPSCVVLPTSTSDVAIIIKQIVAAGADFAIKAAGHNPNARFSSVENGVLISLQFLNAKHYDKQNDLAIYGPGTSFGEVYRFFATYNRVVVGARLAEVGTGLGLGGGLSYLSSQYGLVADGFRELEVVLPSGQVTTASAKQNPDLFLALKGGGGNAYGVVTKYTVQARPLGSFYGGLIYYYANQTNAVLEVIRDFTMYNTDPKAAIIGTYQKFPQLPSIMNMDEMCGMFIVYDGPNPGHVFDNFTQISNIYNSLKGGQTYHDLVNLPFTDATVLGKGDKMFRNAVYHIQDTSYLKAIENWRQWGEENKDFYQLISIDFQPIPKSLTDASKQQGGNALALPDGPWYWLNYHVQSKAHLDDETYNQFQASFKKMVESVPSAKDLPLFPNDCAYDQNPLQTFSTFPKLQATKKKFDPTNYFGKHTGGWSFAAA